MPTDQPEPKPPEGAINLCLQNFERQCPGNLPVGRDVSKAYAELATLREDNEILKSENKELKGSSAFGWDAYERVLAIVNTAHEKARHLGRAIKQEVFAGKRGYEKTIVDAEKWRAMDPGFRRDAEIHIAELADCEGKRKDDDNEQQ